MPRHRYETSRCVRDIGSLGVIEGLTLSRLGEAKIHYFGGIPYAQPPLGQYRFRRPRALAPCYRYGHTSHPGIFSGRSGVCPQPGWRREADPSTWNENCLELNIYVPAGSPPRDGWPVYFYIHGGFLQFGDANQKPEAIAPLLSETDFRCIVVMPAYRINVFGFLTSKELQAEAASNHEPTGNYGFWDQRLALEWTWKNITLFSGNQSRITVGGYSAGAHSAFQQLTHELYFVPDDKAIIKAVIMWSNGCGVQAKDMPEHQDQFDELLSVLGISHDFSAQEKLASLRSTSDRDLVAAQDKLKLLEFRALTDDRFVSAQVIKHINNGDFGRRMKRRGIRLMIGENSEEHNLYRAWRTPGNSVRELSTRLRAEYPAKVVTSLLRHYCPSDRLPAGMKDWQDLFGHIYADVQVHALERGFVHNLFLAGLAPGKDVFRYRFDKRMACVDVAIPPAWGVTHATDMAIWWYGLDYGDGLSETEKAEVKTWISAFASFIRGDALDWGSPKATDVRRLRADGKTDVWRDDRWEAGLRVWPAINGPSEQAAKAQL